MYQRGLVASVIDWLPSPNSLAVLKPVPTMPSIKQKVKALDGEIIQYAERSGWYYRSYSRETRRYTLKLIKDAETLEQALSTAYKALQEVMEDQRTDRPKRQRKTVETLTGAAKAPLDTNHEDLQRHVNDYLKHVEQRVQLQLGSEGSLNRKRVTLRKHFINYLNLNGIYNASQITETTFDDYVIYRRGMSKQTVKTELKDIKTFIKYWLVRHKLVSIDIGLSPTLTPDVRLYVEDLDANPAFLPEDYQRINEYIRKEWIGGATNHKGFYFRHMFHCFLHILKNSGCRPKELLSLRYKDVTITNPKRYSESKGKHVDDWKLALYIPKSKTGKPRTVYCLSNAADNLKAFIEYQRKYCLEQGYRSPRMDDLVFGRPDELFAKTYGHRYLNQTLRQIIDDLKGELKGSPTTDKNYTLYSCRSSFIESCIVHGLDIYTTAKLAGNSVKTIERFYDKSDLRRQAPQIQNIRRGVHKAPPIETFPVI
jgi:integrase